MAWHWKPAIYPSSTKKSFSISWNLRHPTTIFFSHIKNLFYSITKILIVGRNALSFTKIGLKRTFISSKAAFTRQTKVGKLKLVCVNGTKTVGKHLGKQLARYRTCLYSRQLFLQLFRVGKLVSDVNDWQTCVGNWQPIKTRGLFTWFTFVTLRKKADASQHESGATFKFIEEVHNCPAVWDVSSVACNCKDTKTNKRK